jgi:hypothetical protein
LIFLLHFSIFIVTVQRPVTGAENFLSYVLFGNAGVPEQHKYGGRHAAVFGEDGVLTLMGIPSRTSISATA